MMSSKVSYSTSFKSLEGRYKYLISHSVLTMVRLSCVQCKDILVEPHQADCGCRFCLNCLKRGTKVCPECKTNLTSQNGVTVKYDKAAEREILQLEIMCINDGCGCRCKIKDLDAHLAKCEHKKSDKIRCEDCGVTMLRENFHESHRNVSGDNSLLCVRWSGMCPHGCSEDVHGNIKGHLSECKNMPVECPMKYEGCCKVLGRGAMEAHIKEDVHEHMRLMMVQLTELKMVNERLRSEYEEKNARLENEIRMLKDFAAEKSTEMSKLKLQYKREINTSYTTYTLSNCMNAIHYAKATHNGILLEFNDNESIRCYTIIIKVLLDLMSNRVLVYFKIICTSMEYVLYNEKIFSLKLFEHHIAEIWYDCDYSTESFPLEVPFENEINFLVEFCSVPMLESE